MRMKMKTKLLFCAALFLSGVLYANAQASLIGALEKKDATEMNEKDLKEQEKQLSGEATKPEQKRSGFEISYLGVEDGFGLDFSLLMKGFYLSGGMTNGKDVKYGGKTIMQNIKGWYAGVGYNYRYYIVPRFYIEGRAGILYSHSSYEYKSGSDNRSSRAIPSNYGQNHSSSSSSSSSWEKESNGGIGLGIAPQIGICLFQAKSGSDLCLIGGYHWTFAEFKFDKEHKNDYFSVGIAVNF